MPGTDVNSRQRENLHKSWQELKTSLRKNRARIIWLLSIIPVIQFWAQLLTDTEYAGQDPTVRGLRIFDWAKAFFPGKYRPLTESGLAANVILFPRGADGISGKDVTQGGLYDCRFLSAVASLASSSRGRKLIFDMIRQNEDGSFTVTFPGDAGHRLNVTPLTETELRLYARAEDRATRQNRGQWLPVLEKAYGQYRVEHMDVCDHCLRFCKHLIFEARPTSTPILLGFAASYGSGDDRAVDLLTGKSAHVLMTWGFEVGNSGPGKGYVTMRQVRSWLNRAEVVKQFEEEQHNALVASIKNGGIANAGTELSAEATSVGLRSGHAYAVLGYDTTKRMLLICDPMGKVEIHNADTGSTRDGVNDGIFVLSLPDFNRYFSHLAVQDGS